MDQRDRDLGAFIDARSCSLLCFAYLLTGDLGLAQDLLQDSLIKVYLSWGRIRDRAALEAHTRTVMIRTQLSWWRRQVLGMEPTNSAVRDHHSVDEGHPVDQREAQWRLLATLRPRQRAVLVLRLYQELSVAEIARVLGCTTRTVKSQLNQGLARLREPMPAEPRTRNPDLQRHGGREVMSDELSRLLTETLRSRDTDIVPMPELTPRILRQGRSARKRRPSPGRGVTSVVVAAAVVAVAFMWQQWPQSEPARTGMPSPSATSPATVPGTVTDDPLVTYAGKLPVGRPIALIPRAEKRGTKVVVVTADHVVTLPADTATAFDLTSSTEGLLVNTHAYGFTGGGPDPDQALYLIRLDGSLTKLHKGPFDGLAVDPTGKEFAIAEISERTGAPVHITVAPLSAPGRTVRHTEPTVTRLLGWTTHGLLLSDSSRSWLWMPGASSEPKIPGVSNPSVIPSDPSRLLVVTGRAGARFCLHLYTLSSRQLGPELTCGSGADWTVSPDGRHAVVGSGVVDLATGSVGPDLMGNLGFSFPQWEDSTHVLTPVTGADPQGRPLTPIWVRCDISTGACAQAPITGSNGTSAVIDW